MTIYEIASFVFYNNHSYNYCNCVKINVMPSGALKNIVRKIPKPKLSPFDSFYEYCDESNRCIYQLLHPETKTILYESEIGVLFNFLITNGYTINTDITKIMKDKNKNLLFYVEH